MRHPRCHQIGIDAMSVNPQNITEMNVQRRQRYVPRGKPPEHGPVALPGSHLQMARRLRKFWIRFGLQPNLVIRGPRAPARTHGVHSLTPLATWLLL